MGTNTSARRALPASQRPVSGPTGSGLFYDPLLNQLLARPAPKPGPGLVYDHFPAYDLVFLTQKGRAYLERRFPRDGRQRR